MTQSATFRHVTSQDGPRMISVATLMMAGAKAIEPKQLTPAIKKRELSRHTHGTARPRPVHPSYIHRRDDVEQIGDGEQEKNGTSDDEP